MCILFHINCIIESSYRQLENVFFFRLRSFYIEGDSSFIFFFRFILSFYYYINLVVEIEAGHFGKKSIIYLRHLSGTAQPLG